MAVEVGSIVEATVTKLLKYGMLVKLPDGETGFVHISEVDESFVQDVNEFFRPDDAVEVKVLGTSERGTLECSVKQALREQRRAEGEEPAPRPRMTQEQRASFEDKLSDFMKQSSERLLDLKRNIEAKRGGKRR